MQKLERIFSGLLKTGTLLSSFALILMVCLQIFARFFLTSAPSWTEEASRIFFIYAMSFAAGPALKSRYYVHMDLFFNSLPKIYQKRLLLFIDFILGVFFSVVLIYSIQFFLLGFQETSPSLGIPMAIPFFSIVILSLTMAFYSFTDFLKILKKR